MLYECRISVRALVDDLNDEFTRQVVHRTLAPWKVDIADRELFVQANKCLQQAIRKIVEVLVWEIDAFIEIAHEIA